MLTKLGERGEATNCIPFPSAIISNTWDMRNRVRFPELPCVCTPHYGRPCAAPLGQDRSNCPRYKSSVSIVIIPIVDHHDLLQAIKSPSGTSHHDRGLLVRDKSLELRFLK